MLSIIVNSYTQLNFNGPFYALDPVNQNLEGGWRNLHQKGVVYFDVAYTPTRATAGATAGAKLVK